MNYTMQVNLVILSRNFKRGYLFERGNIFSEYVDFLFNLKKNSEKSTPNYVISKLLLNSLYGRLGMSPITENHVIISSGKAIDCGFYFIAT